MAVIDHAGAAAGAKALERSIGAAEAAQALRWIRAAIADDLWRWLMENRDRTLLRVNKWIFTFDVKGRHLYPVFELLLGPRPGGGGGDGDDAH